MTSRMGSKILFTVLITGILIGLMGCDDNGTAPSSFGSLKGVVKNSSNDQVITGVEVSFYGLTQTTDSSGEYMFNDIPTGNHTVAVNDYRFETYASSAAISENDTTNHDIMLDPVPAGAVVGDVTFDPELPSVALKIVIGNIPDTFEVVNLEGDFDIDSIPEGTYQVEIIPEDHYFVELIDSVTIDSGLVTDMGDIVLRDLYADRIIEYNGFFVNQSFCLGFTQGTYTHVEPTGGASDTTHIIIDMGEGEEIVVGPGNDMYLKFGGVGDFAGEIRVAEDDSLFRDTTLYWQSPEFTHLFPTPDGGAQLTAFNFGQSKFQKIRYIRFHVQHWVDEGRLYYIKARQR